MEKADIDIITVDRMQRQKILWPTYRVEIKKTNITPNMCLGRRYYSNTYGHHIYFLAKRIIGYVEKKYGIPHFNQSNNINLIIKYLECEHSAPTNIVLHHLFLLDEMREIIIQNAYQNNFGKHQKNVLEACDSNKFGGGFGVTDKWSLLLYYLTICTEEIPLYNSDLIIFYETLKTKFRNQKKSIAQNQSAKETIKEAIRIKKPTIYVTENFNNQDMVNKIALLINEMYSDNLLNPDSNLSQNLNQNIEKIQSGYNKSKSIILQKKYHSYKPKAIDKNIN